MEIFNNTTKSIRDDLEKKIARGSRISVAAACFSLYAYQELKSQLESCEDFRFIFTSPTFIAEKTKKERREFYISRLLREKSLYGTEFEVRLRNELKQKAVAKECAEWMRQKARFKSNVTREGMNNFLLAEDGEETYTYSPMNAFTTVDLGCERGNKMTNMVTRFENPASEEYLRMFDSVWSNEEKLADVTGEVVEMISSVYQENPPELIYFMTLYHIFNEFLEDVSEDVLPNEATGFKDSVIWNKLFNFQKDAALAIINKLEQYNGCVLADSVGLGKTFTALAVIKYYEGRNKNALVLCPKKLSENRMTYRGNLINNSLAGDRLRYDVLYHTDLSRDSGDTAVGLQIERINWGNYDLVVIDESHNFRNGNGTDSRGGEKENRYMRLMKINLLKLLSLMVRDITPEHDSKLNELLRVIRGKAASPINEDNKKILIFTAFSDTAEYLYENVGKMAKEELGLHTAIITGTVDGKTTIPGFRADMNRVLSCFSPRSKDRDVLYPKDRDDIDILIGTDCISEGQNLQDCDYCVNYDIHWNPVRIIRRFGRIDRIGSKNKVIQLVNFWPDLDLDEYINLKSRVETRMRISVMTSTGDDDLINAEEKGDLEYRRSQLKRLQEEVVDLEDMTGGISIMDLGLNEFRMDLLAYMKEHDDVDHTPPGIHAVTKGEEPGTIFVLKNINEEINIEDQNRLHPFYMVYVGMDGKVITNHLQPKDTLDIMRHLARGKPEADKDQCAKFNKSTDNGKNMGALSHMLEDAIASIIDVKDEGDIDSFFGGGRTTFLSGGFSGLDDF